MSIRATKNLNDILMILSVLSGVLVFVAAAYGIFDSSWPVRMYFSLLAMLFDLVFVFELLGRLSGLLKSSMDKPQERRIETGLLILTSLVPFVLVSGPFLLGWMQSDFSSAAVRGYWTSRQGFSFLSSLTCFRLLRLARPLLVLPCKSHYKKVMLLSIAALAGFLLIATLLVESMILPGHKKMLNATRTDLTMRMSAVSPADAVLIGRQIPDILAIAIDGKAVFSRPETRAIKAGNYQYYSEQTSGIWFSLFPIHRIRAASEAIISGAVCILLLAIAFFSLAPKKSLLTMEIQKRRIEACADLPIGEEELDGILGKSR